MSSFKAFDKRTKTLLVEYKNQFKANKFTDKRIGENDSTLTLEDKMFKRFVKERQKPRDRKAKKFNLNDNDDDDVNEDGDAQVELTHFGQSLSQIENFEKMAMSDDDEVDYNDPNDKDKGKISAKIVSENFFGGFGKHSEEKATDEELKKKNRKQWVEEMIAKSKQLKYERQKERDVTLDMTEQLDKEWRTLLPVIGSMTNKLKDEEEKRERLAAASGTAVANKKPDDYDVLVRSLQFDGTKAQAGEKTKKPEDLERERQEELERQRKELLERMASEVSPVDNDADNGPVSKTNLARGQRNVRKLTDNHLSVDDMEFNDAEYVQQRNREDIKSKQKALLDELKANEQQQQQQQHKRNDRSAGESATGEKASDDESADENEHDDSDTVAHDSDEEEEEEKEEEEEEDDNSESGKRKQRSSASLLDEPWSARFDLICRKYANKSIDLVQLDKLTKALIAKLDPALDEKNKQRICLLARKLVDFYQSLYAATEEKTTAVDTKAAAFATKLIYELTFKYGNKSTRKDPSPYVAFFKQLLSKLDADYTQTRMSERTFPPLSTLFTFKLIATVFPTSDFRHQVTTPCLLIMTRYLTQCSVKTIGECVRGTFLAHLCFEFVSKSKRLIPECVQFLNGMLYLAIEAERRRQVAAANHYEVSSIYEAFKRTQLKLVPKKQVDELSELHLASASRNQTDRASDTLIATLIAYSVDVLYAFVKAYELIDSFRELFYLTSVLLKQLPLQTYPSALKDRVNTMQQLIDETTEMPREHLKCLKKKPIPSRLFEPKVESKSKFDPRHHNSVISEKQLNARKYKKELKSAIKEIRQDNKFLARVQLQDQMEKDAKRSQKVKEIMGGLATQEGEYQKAKRLKN